METEVFNATVEVDIENEIAEENSKSLDSKILPEAYLDQLEDEYDRYATECEAGMQKALLSIHSLSAAFDRSGKRNPFDRIESRIKTFKSVKGKCKDRGYELTSPSIQEHIKDVAGIRIITKYLDEISLVKDMILQIPEINIISIKDYVSQPKENGYKSVHLQCQVGVYDPFRGSRMRPLEIQIRTKTMNLWASLDHDINYKNPNHMPEVEEKFLHIAEILSQLEEEAMSLRDYCEAAKETSSASADLL